ncbi:lytic transglycosylase domain-containing protein [Pararhizobium haloflavum]|uniref:lytic transglycosylase domain-containing protein n=1 Tax=Pararhizobium haloflavum TaxID=2037914 RepID=UPI0018E4D15B|nr:lytic transglycosylase domain-containing protein [Pararhizobium haloflavum]
MRSRSGSGGLSAPSALRTLWVALFLGGLLPAAPVALKAAEVPSFCSSRAGRADEPPLCISAASFNADVCAALEQLSAANDLPPGFFARLIWQESRFDPNAVSPAGAEGIAQFIPSTARLRALEDPFNPAEALTRSAEYLAEMTSTFGSLGLAAIGYNAGEARARLFLGGESYMPGETRHYVRLITGHSVEDWREDPPEDVDFSLDEDKPFREACLELAVNSRISAFKLDTGDWTPWGVQIGADFSRDTAERIFEKVQARHAVLAGEEPLFVPERNRSFGARSRITVRVGRQTREESQALCRQLRQAGAFCLVVRN